MRFFFNWLRWQLEAPAERARRTGELERWQAIQSFLQPSEDTACYGDKGTPEPLSRSRPLPRLVVKDRGSTTAKPASEEDVDVGGEAEGGRPGMPRESGHPAETNRAVRRGSNVPPEGLESSRPAADVSSFDKRLGR